MVEIESKTLDAQVFCLKGWIDLIDPDKLESFFQKELERAEFNILNYVSNRFPNNGFTAMWVLAESHLAIHSFTESGWTYFELTSCNKRKSELVKERLGTTDYQIKFDSTELEESKA